MLPKHSELEIDKTAFSAASDAAWCRGPALPLITAHTISSNRPRELFGMSTGGCKGVEGGGDNDGGRGGASTSIESEVVVEDEDEEAGNAGGNTDVPPSVEPSHSGAPIAGRVNSLRKPKTCRSYM